jgi:broad-specificity NMP kinase
VTAEKTATEKTGSAMGTLIESNSSLLHDRSLKIIAKSLFRELKENGYDNRQIVNLSTELLSLVTSELRNTNQAAAGQ